MLVVLLTVSSCSALKAGLDFVQPATNGIDAEVTVGKKQEEVNTEVGRSVSNTNQAASEIENNINNVPFLFLILLVLGWLLPSPNEMWKGLKGMVLFWRTET